mgnify:CR=1 FL=1
MMVGGIGVVATPALLGGLASSFVLCTISHWKGKEDKDHEVEQG